VAAIDSLLGIIDLQKADGLVLVLGKTPALLGGKGGGSLTMPPLTATMMELLLQELLSAEDRQRMQEGAVIERTLSGDDPARPFAMTARLDSGHPKIVVRRGNARAARPPTIATDPTSIAPIRPAATERTEVTAIEPQPPPPIPAPTSAARSGLPDAIARLLASAATRGVSDVILSAGRPPLAKRGGRVEALAGAVITDGELRALVDACAGDRRADLERQGSVDFALEHGPRRSRYRVNVFRQMEGLAAVLRPIWDDVPSLEALGLPPAVLRAVAPPNGLVLMTGPTGSGKSTTLAALIEHLARTRPCHIVTLEDPIEYLFTQGPAVVHQREVGTHVTSFAAGLRAALRESPDVLLVGEMRDPDTIALALTAAETGHLVLSTLHAGTATGAVERIVHALPEVERAAVRTQLASALRFVLTQQLLPSSDGGQAPAVELLAVNHAIAAQIRDGRTQLLETQIELGGEEGMVTMNQALAELVRSRRVARPIALAASARPDELERLLGDPRPVNRRP
jgi:twitching motility protein PilT